MAAPWFNFSLPDFSYAFMSVLLEGVPFILIGTLVAGFIDQFLPSRLMIRWLPRNPFAGVCISAAMGLVFPMCECGIVPVIRRLMAKGLPISNAVAYMLAAPIVNPLVALSTYAAFGGNDAAAMTFFRLGLGYFVAVLAAMAVHQLPLSQILRKGIISVAGEGTKLDRPQPVGPLARVGAALSVAVSDFLDVMVYFIFGVAISSLFSTSINQEVILPFALSDPLAIFSMMGLAVILSLCSTSDAFIAASFTAFPNVAKLAFLVIGPMLDLKLIFIYSSVFKKRFVVGLAIGLFVMVGLICLRLRNFVNI